MLKAGIVGLPNVGKSTLFNAVTRTRKAEAANYPFCTIEPNVGVVTVPDARLEPLAKIAKTTVIIPAAVEFVDIAGLVKGASDGEGLGNKFLSHIREVDAIVQVVRCFEDPDIHHVTGTIDPVRDIEIINTELVIADLDNIKKRREKLAKDVKRGDKAAVAEDAVLAKFEPVLDAGKLALAVQLTPEEKVVAQKFLPAHRQADHFRLQREGIRTRHRRQKSVRPESAAITSKPISPAKPSSSARKSRATSLTSHRTRRNNFSRNSAWRNPASAISSAPPIICSACGLI